MKMKYRIKHSIMSLAACLAAAWSAVSCTETDPLPVPQEPVSATLTARMDAAWEDAVRGSAEGGLTNLLDQGYSVRYQLEVYPEAGDNPECEYRAEPVYRELKADGDYATVSYDLRLLARRYRFVIWADLVKMDADAQTVSSSWYNVENLRTIGYNDPASTDSPADAADAFTAVQTVDLTAAGQAVSMTLKRPLAKVRVIDIGTAAASAEPASAGAFSTELTFTPALPSGYNALLQQAVSPSGTGYVLPARNSYREEGVGVCLFEGFVFAPAEPADVTVKVSKTDGTAGPWSVDVPRVPLRPNGLTTLKGTVVK